MTCAFVVDAQEAQGASSPDVVAAIFTSPSDTQSFRLVISGALHYRLEASGIALAILPESSDEASLDSSARSAGAPVALSCRYSTAGSEMQIDFEWRDLQQGTPPVRQEGKGPIDLTLDSVILKALDGMLSLVKERVAQLAAQRKAASTAAAEAPRESVPQENAAAAAPVRQAAAESPTVAAPAAIAERPAAPPVQSQQQQAAVEGMRFALASGVAAFLPIGPASSYFAVGVAPYVRASLGLPVPPGRLAIGLYAGTNIFYAAGPLDSALGFLVPVGPDARFQIGSGTPFLAFAHVSGGPALLVLNTSAQGTIVSITGFLKSGVGAVFMFGPRFGLELSVDYEVYFVMPYLIMGVSPALSASLSL